MAKVFLLRAGEFSPEGYGRLLSRFTGEAPLGRTDLAAVKIHAGEQGNTRFISPERVNAVVAALDLPPDRTFLTDTTVLYRGRRLTAPDYILLASEHGFGPPRTPPFIVADGLRGTDEVLVKLPSCCENPSARIAKAICEADAMVVVSHFKGHLLSGFGGALKSLGMGCASRGGKLFQHSSVKPGVRASRCTACGVCANHCPEAAISVTDSARISSGRCVGCGECISRCPTGAIQVDWNQDQGVFARRMAEYALAAFTVTRTLACVNFVVDVVKDCDCLPDSGAPMIDDIGVLASTDPVSLDQACFDLVTKAKASAGSPFPASGEGEDKFLAAHPAIDASAQLAAAQSLGLGSRDYELVEG